MGNALLASYFNSSRGIPAVAPSGCAASHSFVTLTRDPQADFPTNIALCIFRYAARHIGFVSQKAASALLGFALERHPIALATVLENADAGSLRRLLDTGDGEDAALIIPDPKMIRMGAKEP